MKPYGKKDIKSLIKVLFTAFFTEYLRVAASSSSTILTISLM